MKVYLLILAVLIAGCIEGDDSIDSDLQINEGAGGGSSNVVEELVETNPIEIIIEEVEPIIKSDVKPEEYTDPEIQIKLDLAYKELHEPGSSYQIFEDFPDVKLVYDS